MLKAASLLFQRKPVLQTFDFCQLCEDGSVPRDLFSEPLPFLSCLFLASLAIDAQFNEGVFSSDECVPFQASYGEYCECNNVIASEGACRICGGTDAVSEPGAIVTFEGEEVTCGDAEFQAIFRGINETQCEEDQAIDFGVCCGR